MAKVVAEDDRDETQPSASAAHRHDMSTLTESKPQTEATKIRTMTAADRCDACGAQAYASATFKRSELLFCGHHFTRHEDKMVAIAASVRDERSFLVSKVSSVGEGFV